jgi:hypothetical protein
MVWGFENTRGQLEAELGESLVLILSLDPGTLEDFVSYIFFWIREISQIFFFLVKAFVNSYIF